jgi:hypothetical protein
VKIISKTMATIAAAFLLPGCEDPSRQGPDIIGFPELELNFIVPARPNLRRLQWDSMASLQERALAIDKDVYLLAEYYPDAKASALEECRHGDEERMVELRISPSEMLYLYMVDLTERTQLYYNFTQQRCAESPEQYENVCEEVLKLYHLTRTADWAADYLANHHFFTCPVLHEPSGRTFLVFNGKMFLKGRIISFRHLVETTQLPGAEFVPRIREAMEYFASIVAANG